MMEPIPITQTELQRMHDLSCSFTMTKSEYIEMGELARRAVQMIVKQSLRIKQLKGILAPTKPDKPLVYRQLKDRTYNENFLSELLGIKF